MGDGSADVQTLFRTSEVQTDSSVPHWSVWLGTSQTHKKTVAVATGSSCRS